MTPAALPRRFGPKRAPCRHPGTRWVEQENQFERLCTACNEVLCVIPKYDVEMKGNRGGVNG